MTILGITARSFARPDILLRAKISADPGYFGERLTTARQELIKEWEERAAHLAPDAKQTDILGALLVASQIFQESPNTDRKILMIYSDMRQATPSLDLERSRLLHANSALRKARKADLLAELSGVAVDVMGADAVGRNAAQWEILRRF